LYLSTYEHELCHGTVCLHVADEKTAPDMECTCKYPQEAVVDSRQFEVIKPVGCAGG